MQDIKMVVEWFHVESVVKKYGFRLTDATLSKMKDGWLELVVNWEADKDAYLFKNCYSYGTLWASDYVCQSLRFTNLPKNFKVSLDIGIQVKNLSENIEYTPEFFNNLKYGAAVYFSPKDWHVDKTVLDEHNFSSL